ncbi:MAG: hypothetical protein K5979_04260 [Ruminococcus sp.]|nr:hypothetical protein [Ruminococcus sp.]
MKDVIKTLFKIFAVFLAVITFIILLLFASCTAHKKESTKKGNVPGSVITNAEKFIKRKYGIKAKVTKSVADYEWEGFDFIIPHKNYTGTYNLDMKAGDTEFNVFVTADGTFKDDYQSSEIEESLQTFFAEMLPSPDIRLKAGIGTLNEYIDCSDIESFVNEHQPDISVYLVDSELNSSDFDEIKDFAHNYNSTVYLMSCRSAESRDALIDGKRTKNRGDVASSETSFGSDYAMHVKEIWKCVYKPADDVHTEEYNELKIGHYGNLYYTIPEDAEVTVKDSDKNCYKRDKYDDPHKFITPAYELCCSENFTVFYPVEKADDVEPELGQAYKCCENQVDIIGDYFVYRIHTKHWYNDNHYSGPGDKQFFGVYIDNYY